MIAAASALAFNSPNPAGAVVLGCHTPTPYELYTKLPREFPKVYRAIRKYWQGEWTRAAGVSYGESGWYTTARNGQYHGIFQMGSSERAKYGDGETPELQARAAHRYYLDSGWGPWDCG